MTWTEFKTLTIDEDFTDGPLLVEVRLSKERALYGADADGRRGEVRDFIEDVNIEAVYDLETGADVTDKWKGRGDLEHAIRATL